MRILYAALRDDYGDPARGPSVEEQNFLPTLRRMGHDVVPFDYLAELRRVGYEEMNRGLLRLVRDSEPDLLFCVLFEDQLDERVIREISEDTDTVTFNWFCDDHWRFDGYSKYWAKNFNWVATTDEAAVERYQAHGIDNVLLTQWGCNPELYFPRDAAQSCRYDVTFVGQPHGDRRRLVSALQRSGIGVECWGNGWPNGRLTLDEMTATFSSSRINLNFSAASAAAGRLRRRKVYQLKARPFEIAACGGFVLTEQAPGLERFFDIDREITVFKNRRDLVAKAREFLDDDHARREIAERGRRRVIREHTYDRRLDELFAQMGLGSERRPVPS